MVFWVIIQLAVAVALLVVSYALAPKPPKQRPPEMREPETPTAEAGRPVPVTFGTVTIQGPNLLWVGEKGKLRYEAGKNQPPNADDNPDVVGYEPFNEEDR